MILPDELQRALSGKRLLIFDFDGTIADTSPLHARAFAETLAPLGVPVDYPAIAGRKTLDALVMCFAMAGAPAPGAAELARLTERKQAAVRQLIRTCIEPLPGVDVFLRWAKERYHIALVTSGSRGTASLALERLGYGDWFNPALFAEDVVNAKPDPEGFFRVLELSGHTADEALIFEDSEAGFEASRSAQMAYVDASVLAYPLFSRR